MHPNPARRRRAHTVLLAVALGPVLGLAVAQPASAHDRLVSSDPADGARLDEPPSTITLVFSAEVLEAGAQVAVTTPDGTVPAQVSVDGDEATATLPDDLPGDLPGGDWTVTWRVVSSDGHPIEGELEYTVAGTSPSPTSSPTSSPPPTPSSAPADPSPGGAHEHGTGTPGAELDAAGEAGWTTAWLFPVGVLAVVGVAAAVMLARRRDQSDHRSGDEPGDHHDEQPGPEA
ncbi:MAG: copper resistance CopC family protein [Pseudonocardia sp.]